MLASSHDLHGADALAFSGAYFGNGSGPIHLDNVECSGNETSLQECVHVEGEFHNCGHTEDASVRCKGEIADACVYSKK